MPYKYISVIFIRGNIVTIYVLTSIAFLILFIAAINYINLSIATSSKRIKEIGIKKVIGANKSLIILQYLGEAIIYTFLSMWIAIVISEALNYSINIIPAHSAHVSTNWYLVLGLSITAIILGIITGSYISIYFLRLTPVDILKGNKRTGNKDIPLKRIFTVIQFTVSIILIIGSITIYKQLTFIRNQHLGFNSEDQLMVIGANSETLSNYDFLRNKLLQYNSIKGICRTNGVPPHIYHYSKIDILPVQETRDFLAKHFFGDADYFDVMGLELIQGEKFNTASTDSRNVFIVNETLVKELNLDSPIGKSIKSHWNGTEGEIIGVVKDFHYKSFHEKIEPVVIGLEENRNIYALLMRIDPVNIPETLSYIQSVWKTTNPEWPISYHFVSDDFNQLYSKEHKVSKIISAFSILAIFISCLGLFALVLYMMENRTKEIGIRKVCGASFESILGMVTKEFVGWIVIAFFVAVPLAYYITNKWLQNFVYRIEISWQVFGLAGILILVLVLITISFQSIKVARKNPVEALRYE